jgi:glucuronate isomerase
MKTFITEDFLLNSKTASKLYHDFVKDLPIIDYHNHLPPKDVALNRKFKNITELWLEDDHYKWRAMRTLGIDEKYITGNASDVEKFIKWAAVVNKTVRNPLYHWSHLELLRYFGINSLLDENNAKEIYKNTSEKLCESSYFTKGLLSKQKVKFICTTDDPIDDLRYHQKLLKEDDSFEMKMSFRADKLFSVENSISYSKYLQKLEQSSNIQIKTFDDLLDAISNRIMYFHKNGCRISDHGLTYLPYFETGAHNIDNIFNKLKNHKNLNLDEIYYFKCETLKYLTKTYHKLGWVQQFHLGPIRSVNTRLTKKLGRDSGFDSIGEFPQALSLSKFLDYLDKTDQLTKTILYNSNPIHNEVFVTMSGNFNDGSVKGKVQFGAAWWFLDQKNGIEKQLNVLSDMGLVSSFIGMLTDSRSFLSFPRHEYFRRILCNLFGDEIEKGLLPNDMPFIGKILADISYYNALDYFSLNDS